MKIINEYQENFPIRRWEKKTRLYIDNEFFDKGYAALLGKKAIVYFVLAKYANAKKQSCFPSYETIMRDTGNKNRNLISKALKALESLNIISIRRSDGRRANTYYLIDSAHWKELNSINADTVRSVLKSPSKQYQNWPSNRINTDTGSLRSNATKEIKNKRPKEIDEAFNKIRKNLDWLNK